MPASSDLTSAADRRHSTRLPLMACRPSLCLLLFAGLVAFGISGCGEPKHSVLIEGVTYSEWPAGAIAGTSANAELVLLSEDGTTVESIVAVWAVLDLSKWHGLPSGEPLTVGGRTPIRSKVMGGLVPTDGHVAPLYLAALRLADFEEIALFRASPFWTPAANAPPSEVTWQTVSGTLTLDEPDGAERCGRLEATFTGSIASGPRGSAQASVELCSPIF